ncbi:tryptophan synthase subunit beta [Candidatus Zinderia endosymbiont of Aphrophora alni]|uniref:tryptophan synthase subunit beta n=1 Tax=Candidatus Zinderia endosymbiont of Aphrophora alni TaxID=3077951 RepID=UPI0030D61489
MKILNNIFFKKINKNIYNLPNKKGYFGKYGGKFISETLILALQKLQKIYIKNKNNKNFINKINNELKNFIGRPTPIYYAKNLSKIIGGAKIFLKREDLNHTGSHKINNVIGQIILAKKMNKKRIIAESGAGQHGVAVATVAAKFGMDCNIYMGSKDIKRQLQNVYKINLLGATVIPVNSGSKTLKDALNEAIRDWTTNIETTFYVIGTVAGPHPYPTIVRNFQSIIGKECIKQMHKILKKQPDYIIAAIGGGSNAIGIFYPYINYKKIKLLGIEAAGKGLKTNKHAASLLMGSSGILHGNRTYLLQDKYGQILKTHSISAGLDYPGVGPEHSFLKDIGRIKYKNITDNEALSAFYDCCNIEGIIPALESSHALAYALKISSILTKKKNILINLSGRGDKDMHTIKNINKNL